MLAEPTTIAPASRGLLTAVESIGEIKSRRIVEAAEDCIPFVRILSLIAIGMPSNFDLGTSERKKYDKHRFDDTFVSQTKSLTFLDALLRLFSFPEGLATIANVYIAIEVLLAIDVFVGGLD